MLRGIDYGTGEEVLISNWLEKLVSRLLELLNKILTE